MRQVFIASTFRCTVHSLLVAERGDVKVEPMGLTLGLDFLSDRQIPRVLGALALVLLAINNLASSDDPSPASIFALLSCLSMSLFCMYIPTLELQLKDVAGGNIAAKD